MKKQFTWASYVIFGILLIIGISSIGYSQEKYKDPANKDLNELYEGGSFYEIENYIQSNTRKRPENIIPMIGDGGDYETGMVQAKFTTGGHTGIAV